MWQEVTLFRTHGVNTASVLVRRETKPQILIFSELPLWLNLYRIRLQCRKPGFDPWDGKNPREGHVHPLQYSGLENSMDCIVHGVTKVQHDWVTFPFNSEFPFYTVIWGFHLRSCEWWGWLVRELQIEPVLSELALENNSILFLSSAHLLWGRR